MTVRVTLVQSDSTGPEAFELLPPVFAAAGADVAFEPFDASDGDVTDELIAAIRDTGLALMGFQWGKHAQDRFPPSAVLRQKLGIHTNLRPIRNRTGFARKFKDTDFWIVRESTEDVYAAKEHESIPGVYEGLKVTTEAACRRIARAAFELARERGRRKVTTVHKANIMKLSDGLFLRVSREVAADYPDIQHDDVIVDACCMKLVIDPTQFDVLLCGNLFGDILGDLGAGLVGGAANTPSINLGEGVALFSIGNRGPRATDADPLPLLISGLYLLEHIGQQEARDRLAEAMKASVRDGIVPRVIGGDASCSDFLGAVRGHLG